MIFKISSSTLKKVHSISMLPSIDNFMRFCILAPWREGEPSAAAASPPSSFSSPDRTINQKSIEPWRGTEERSEQTSTIREENRAEQSRVVTVSLFASQPIQEGDCTGSAIAEEPHSTGSTSSSSSGRRRLPQLRPPQLRSPLHLCSVVQYTNPIVFDYLI